MIYSCIQKRYLDKRTSIVSISAEKKLRLAFCHRNDFQNKVEIIQKEFIVRGLILKGGRKINYLIFNIS